MSAMRAGRQWSCMSYANMFKLFETTFCTLHCTFCKLDRHEIAALPHRRTRTYWQQPARSASEIFQEEPEQISPCGRGGGAASIRRCGAPGWVWRQLGRPISQCMLFSIFNACTCLCMLVCCLAVSWPPSHVASIMRCIPRAVLCLIHSVRSVDIGRATATYVLAIAIRLNLPIGAGNTYARACIITFHTHWTVSCIY